MTKAQIIERMASEAGMSKTAAAKALESFMDSIVASLKEGKRVTLVGFGTFSVAKRSARVGRNPFTGAPIKIKAKKVARFKGSKDLLEKL